MAQRPIADSVERVRMRRLVVVLSLALSVPTTAVQLFGDAASHSDYGTHLELVDHLQRGHLEVPHFVFHGAVAILGFLVSTSIATLVIIALAQVALGLLVFRVMSDSFELGLEHAARASRLALGTTIVLLISAPIGVFTFPHLFIGYITTTTYHNPTIQVLKPLALLLFLRLHDDVLAEPPIPRASPGLANLAILSIVTTMAKPSFSIVALPALCGLALVYRRTLPLRRTLATLAVFGLAIGVVIVWQTLFLRQGDSDEGIAFQPFFVALAFEPHKRLLVAKLLLSIAFPLLALIFNRRAALADRRLVFSYACFLVSLLYYFLLAERGTRVYHGNFGWGVMASLFLVFVSTSAMLARRGAAVVRATLAPWLTLLVHGASGLLWLAASNGLLGHLCDDGWGNWCW